MEELSFADIPGELPLLRLKRLGSVAALADMIHPPGDTELAAKASAAGASARAERGKTALIGADDAIAAELLGELAGDAKVATKTVNGVRVYLSLDGQRKCRGIYLTGATDPGHALGDGTLRLLSQAVGHTAAIRAAKGGVGTSQWMEGATPVLARWRSGTLMELRIGDATP